MSQLFGFPSGLSGGSKETEYNTSFLTAETTNFNTLYSTSRGSSHSTDVTTNFSTSRSTSRATDQYTSWPVNNYVILDNWHSSNWNGEQVRAYFYYDFPHHMGNKPSSSTMCNEIIFIFVTKGSSKYIFYSGWGQNSFDSIRGFGNYWTAANGPWPYNQNPWGDSDFSYARNYYYAPGQMNWNDPIFQDNGSSNPINGASTGFRIAFHLPKVETTYTGHNTSITTNYNSNWNTSKTTSATTNYTTTFDTDYNTDRVTQKTTQIQTSHITYG